MQEIATVKEQVYKKLSSILSSIKICSGWKSEVLSLYAACRAVDGTVCKTDSAVSWTLVHAVAQMRGLSGPNRII